tara:strand:+ start:173 stop:886 length:714 start_codon:yes stop_codon:yes gene_type:complete
MPSKTYKEARICDCGYTTVFSSAWSVHKKRCTIVLSGDKERIVSLEKQLLAKDEHYQKELAAKNEQIKEKDVQIKELIQVAKKPRTVNNNTTNKYVVEQKINVFGKESIEHISTEQIQALLADPANAVPQLIKLKHRRAPDGVNHNVRIPNQKRAIYQVVVRGEGEEKEWENKAKGDVLEQLYDDNSGHLEAEADEDTRVGSRFLDHQDRVKLSAGGEDGGRRYKEQLDKIHCVISG